MAERVDVRGVTFDNVTMEEATARLGAALAAEEGFTAVYTPNAEIVQRCIDDAQTRELVNGAELIVPDGIGVIKAARILDTPLQEKVAGVELGRHALEEAAKAGVSAFFLGGKPGVAEAAAGKMKEQIPNLLVSGTHDGYFKKSGAESEEVVRQINESGAALLLVCLGAPTQEIWIRDNRDAMPQVRVAMGLGGSLDVYAGNVRRAPKIFIKLGLEWFYRLLTDPRRIGRMMQLPRFYFGTILFKMRKKHKK